jgi:pimeloyl-ACP methyl ester carboxylesterase
VALYNFDPEESTFMREVKGYVPTPDGVRLFFHHLGSAAHAVIVPNAVHMFDSFRHLANNRTVIFFDLRNRGNSDSVGDREKLTRGIHHDVDDIEAVRQHFGFDKVDLIGHSYVGLMVILYAMKYPANVNRVVQIGPSQPDAATQYPAHLTGADATLAEFAGKVAQLRQAPPPADPKAACNELGLWCGRLWRRTPRTRTRFAGRPAIVLLSRAS